MLKNELLKRSPIRILEKTIHGGLGKGNLGVFTARKGVGKTACLVHFGIDHMLSAGKVLHISFSDAPHHIENWYKQVFDELAQTYRLENSIETFEEMLHHRLILHLKGLGMSFDKIREKINTFTENDNFKPQILIIDGYPFEQSTPQDLQEWKNFAQKMNSEIWFSATIHREHLDLDEEQIPAPVNSVKKFLDVIIMLEPKVDHVHLSLLKDNKSAKPDKLHLKLDPHSMLISNHRV
jgi:hypothetical protein